jgi:superfamily I DNA/RNA helicase
MQLTPQQLSIIATTGNIKINAVAGSGKTSTIIAFAKSKPNSAKILYLAFNKSVKIDAEQKFSAQQIQHVTIETAHSLAFKHIIYGSNYKINTIDYKPYDVARILDLAPNVENYILANHVLKMVAFFCNSNVTKVQDINYLEMIEDGKAKIFVKKLYTQLELLTRQFLGKMNNALIEITHDFYLKKFQLANPQLPFDYILFDEGQDASPAMLAVFMQQQATKVIVGDVHQQIYSWRYAINSLQQLNYPNHLLSTSFRFKQDIANLAMQILGWKDKLIAYQPITITGAGGITTATNKAIIGRTNLGLLLKAIEYITDNRKVKSIYFEGNISSYTYAADGASLYDVLNLYNEKKHLIRDDLLKTMGSIAELEHYITQTEDAQLGMMLEVVKEYENEIPNLLKKLKVMHVPNAEKQKAEIIFSTVHRCKGMEYDEVELVADFITAEKLDKIINKKDEKGKQIKLDTKQIEKLLEEINLLYVAVTRTKKLLRIPISLLPEGIKPSESIQVITPIIPGAIKKEMILPNYKSRNKNLGATNTKSFTAVRDTKQVAYQPWTAALDAELKEMFDTGFTYEKMAIHFGRTKGAIISRLRRLAILE